MPANAKRHPRPPWVLAVLIALLLLEVSVWTVTVRELARPSTGFSVRYEGSDPRAILLPLTPAAAAAVDPLTPPVYLRRANGRDMAAVPMHDARNRPERYFRRASGERNTFVVRDRRGLKRRFTLAVAQPDLSTFLLHHYRPLAAHKLGLLYLAMGLLVWWLRPSDRGSLPLLLLGVVAKVNTTFALISGPWAVALMALILATVPLWGLTGLLLAVQFTGAVMRPRIYRIYCVVRGVILATSAAIALLYPAAIYRPARFGPAMDLGFGLAALEVFFCMVVMIPFALHAATGPYPEALRRRARLFTIASLAAFPLPSLSLVLQAFDVHWSWFGPINLALLACFPLIIGYAIVRHQMFNLRLVLRRGVVAAGLTLLVSLAYVWLVLLALKLAAAKAPSPLLIGLSVPLVVVVFSLLHVRAQRAVENFVNRRRLVYAEALEQAAEMLSHSRDLRSIAATMRRALVTSMGLRRAYFAAWDPERPGELRCTLLGEREDPNERKARWQVRHLPSHVRPEAYAPLVRALQSKGLVSAHDSEAVSAQSRALPLDAPEERVQIVDEAAFWARYGVEAVLPLTLGIGARRASLSLSTVTGDRSALDQPTGEHEVVGLLLLGSRAGGKALDTEDHALLRTLANQLSVAVKNCYAFDEIRRLNEGLEQQVAERTRELSEALQTLKEAQLQLVESEMQAMLTRLVAGILHEVNSPLGTLRSSVDTMERALGRARTLLESGTPGDEVGGRRVLRAVRAGGELSEVARRSAARISGVLDSLRRFVSLDEAEVKPLELRRAVEDALNLLAPAAGPGVTVTTEFPEEPVRVRCFPARLNKVFLNLLQNAFTAVAGEGTVGVTVRRQGSEVTVEVADNGPGIPAELRARLFDLGFTTKRGGRVGMRLGLPSSKRWVEELGGRLELSSEEGRGTRVRVHLPLGGVPDREKRAAS